MSNFKDIHSLAKHITELQAELRRLGIFDYSRELLECPSCGLMEDITFEGILITSNSEKLGIDTEMRFVELSSQENKWQCLARGYIFCVDNNESVITEGNE